MNRLQIAILLCFCLLIKVQIYGQSYRIYEIREDGSQGRLLRVETYQNGDLVQSDNYQPNGKIAFTLTQKYENDLLVSRIKTMKIDHEFDLIREYTYDSEGQKIGELFGNNRTGKWGSFRFTYNGQGDIETVLIYEKNGDLSRKGIYTYKYDAEGRKTSEARRDIELETDDVTHSNSFIYEYNFNLNQIKTIEKDPKGNIVFTELLTQKPNQQPTSKIIQMAGSAPSTIKYFYESSRIIKEEEYRKGKLTLTTTYHYFFDGQLMEKKYRYANGKFGGEVWKKVGY